MNDFESLVADVLRGIRASAARKRAMREELLAHLASAYEEELHLKSDAAEAAEAARRRFGNTDELRTRLQASVSPLDRLLAMCFQKELLMSRWFWIVAWIFVMAGFCFIVPSSMLPGLFAGTVIGGAGVWRLTHEDGRIARWFGPRWGWRIVAMLLGVGMVLPALAQVKQGRHTPAEAAGPIALGLLFVLIGFVSAVHAMMTRRPQIA